MVLLDGTLSGVVLPWLARMIDVVDGAFAETISGILSVTSITGSISALVGLHSPAWVASSALIRTRAKARFAIGCTIDNYGVAKHCQQRQNCQQSKG